MSKKKEEKKDPVGLIEIYDGDLVIFRCTDNSQEEAFRDFMGTLREHVFPSVFFAIMGEEAITVIRNMSPDEKTKTIASLQQLESDLNKDNPESI